MIFQRDVHEFNKDGTGTQPVKDDDDRVLFRRSTLKISCQLGEKITKNDVSVFERRVLVLPY